MTTTVYGIPNCTTVKRARGWLEARGIDYRFYDLRADGMERDLLERLADAADWHSLLNKQSKTFRELPDKAAVVQDRAAALDAMLQHPTLIKRPVLEHGDRVHVGFNEGEWENTLC
jgi:Spx/MgsR family transcriptional regulator